MKAYTNAPEQTAGQPLVSFIITLYDVPMPMLCECIDSILSLSLRASEREIIVVDDGSVVSPMNGLMQYSQDIVYVRQHNQGVSVARNVGLQMAQGRYIQFVDADDYLLTAPYEHCLDIVRYQPEADIVMFRFTKTVTQSHAVPNNETPMSGAEYMRSHNLRGASWCYLFRQAIRGQLRFTAGVAYAEDEEFTSQLLLRAEVVYPTDAVAYYYRVRSDSATGQKSDAGNELRLSDTRMVIRRLHLLTDRLPVTERLAMQRRVAQLTMDYIYNTIMLTRSRRRLEACIQDLYDEGLFPLPDADYSLKYKWFRRLTNSRSGRMLLSVALPLFKSEP